MADLNERLRQANLQKSKAEEKVKVLEKAIEATEEIEESQQKLTEAMEDLELDDNDAD